MLSLQVKHSYYTFGVAYEEEGLKHGHTLDHTVQ
jgi:hypothetical protein